MQYYDFSTRQSWTQILFFIFIYTIRAPRNQGEETILSEKVATITWTYLSWCIA